MSQFSLVHLAFLPLLFFAIPAMAQERLDTRLPLASDRTPQVDARSVETTIPSSNPASPEPLSASLDLFTIDRGQRSLALRLIVIQIRHQQEIPLAPLLYFTPGSARIPERYSRLDRNGAAAFATDSLVRLDPVELHHHLLDIIGSRMRTNSDETIRLIASRRRGETARAAHARAEAVRTYMREAWQIPEARIAIEVAAISADPENVRLVASERILAPLRGEWIDLSAATSPIEVSPHIRGGSGRRSWTLTLRRNGREVARSASDDHRDSAVSIELRLGTPALDEIPPPIFAELVVRDSIGATAVARDTLAFAMATLPVIRVQRVLCSYLLPEVDRQVYARQLSSIASGVGAGQKVTVEGKGAEETAQRLRVLLPGATVTVGTSPPAAGGTIPFAGMQLVRVE
jgi:hypothetical protein